MIRNRIIVKYSGVVKGLPGTSLEEYDLLEGSLLTDLVNLIVDEHGGTVYTISWGIKKRMNLNP